MESKPTNNNSQEKWRDSNADAFQHVLRYLESEFLHVDLPQGTRIPPVRNVAKHLGVSTTVVHGVYRRLQDEGRLVSSVGRGTFITPRTQGRSQNGNNFCLALSAPIYGSSGGSDWASTIISKILFAATRGSRRVSILPFEMVASEKVTKVDVLINELDQVDGLILFPPSLTLVQADQVLVAYAKARKPVIRLNPPGFSATENFVSQDYFTAWLELGRSMLRAGRRRLAYIGCNPRVSSVSSALRLSGLNTAISEQTEQAVDGLRMVAADDVGVESGRRAMLSLLERFPEPPDAVFTFGDLQAEGVCQVCEEYGLSIPEQVSVVGGTGLVGQLPRNLTSVIPPYDLIGEELIRMALASIEAGGSPQPAKYLPMTYHQGVTTRPEELPH